MRILKVFLAIFLLVLVPSASALAQDAKNWENQAEISAVSTNGNNQTSVISGKNIFKYKWTLSHLELAASALGSSTQDSTVAENYLASEKYAYELNEKNYAFERFAWDKDRFAGIVHRYDSVVGFGRHLLNKDNKTQIAVELGGGYVNEQRDQSLRNDFGSYRGFVKFSHQLSDTAHFLQEVDFSGNAKDTDDYRLTTVSAFTFVLSKHFSLKTSYKWRRAGLPPAGFGKDDSITTLALIATY